MTKVRGPLTFENVLAQVAGHIGWQRVAEIVGQAERTVRNWSDPDTTAQISLEAALKLDEQFHKSGGEGAPFFQCYSMRLKLMELASSPGREALLASITVGVREWGEGMEAAMMAAGLNADRGDFAVAKRELEEAICATQNVLAKLIAREKAFEEGNEGTEPSARALEVAPVMKTI